MTAERTIKLTIPDAWGVDIIIEGTVKVTPTSNSAVPTADEQQRCDQTADMFEQLIVSACTGGANAY